MASTNKTANLSLNQWVPTDPVLMEDMNEDNRKLDGAVGEIGTVKLFGVITAQEVQSIELNFAGIDMSNIVELKVNYSLPVDGRDMYIRLNDLTSSNTLQSVSGTWNDAGSAIWMYYGTASIALSTPAFYITDGSGSIKRTNPNVVHEISKISLYANGKSIPKGTKLVVTGVRL